MKAGKEIRTKRRKPKRRRENKGLTNDKGRK
jgi:hypothetical protein